ncbi:hypothetical protein V1521DRAFT_432374 [Lipomyces starkeyi]
MIRFSSVSHVRSNVTRCSGLYSFVCLVRFVYIYFSSGCLLVIWCSDKIAPVAILAIYAIYTIVVCV